MLHTVQQFIQMIKKKKREKKGEKIVITKRYEFYFVYVSQMSVDSDRTCSGQRTPGQCQAGGRS